ncbi:MAG: hypothetical protein O7B79_05690, partial [SAR324 cluster bacterium]|nr:hypothetical protein [SAR324 cluster bacterium]
LILPSTHNIHKFPVLWIGCRKPWPAIPCLKPIYGFFNLVLFVPLKGQEQNLRTESGGKFRWLLTL